MTYEVRVHRLARLDLGDAYKWAFLRAPNTADRWFDRFRAAIRSLESAPDRCPLATEHRKVNLAIRELLFGRRPNVFRVVFFVDETIVRVLRIRRGQRRPLTRRQIDESLQSDDS